jgi:hypothetical protein
VRIRDIRTLPFYLIQYALIDTIRPSVKALVAYNALCYFAAARASTCAVSLPRMAERFLTSEDSLRRGIAELVEKGAVQKREKFKPNGRRRGGKREQLPNEYVLIDLLCAPGIELPA